MKNIIFDIGNVLLSFQPEEFLKKYYNQSTMNDLMMIIFSSDEWIELDLGNMMIKDAITSLTTSHPHYHDEIIFVLEHWTEMMTPIQENVNMAYQLKEKGYSLYLLSNFHLEAFQSMFKKYDFFQLFDGQVISANEHIIKPDFQIYQILLNKYQLIPSECLFIDDMLANISSANQLGIAGIHLNYQKNLEKELKSIGVL